MLDTLLQPLLITLAAINFLVTTKGSQPSPFHDLRNSPFFVDKTSSLFRSFSGGVGPDNLILKTRRGFGKTTHLDMIRRFAEIDVLPNGKKKKDKLTHKNYHTFAEVVPSTGKHLDVFGNKTWFDKLFGQHPVIWLDLDLKGAKTPDKFTFVRHLLNGTVKAAFQDHEYLLNSFVIPVKDKDLMEKYLYYNTSSLQTPDADFLCEGVRLLKRLLKEHFEHEDVVTLLDNADGPLQDFILDPLQNYADALGKLEVVSKLIETVAVPELDFRDYLPRWTFIACAILPYYEPPLLYQVYDENFDGFTQAEFKALLRRTHMEGYEEKISAWYGGFKNKLNPYSVLSFLRSKTKDLKPYWSELGSLDTFKVALLPDCLGIQIIECFTNCEFDQLEVSFWEMLPEVRQRVKDLQRLTHPTTQAQCSKDHLYSFVSFLENIGYLTNKGTVHRTGISKFCYRSELTFPNLEVRNYVKQLFYSAIVSQTPLNGDGKFRFELFEAITSVNGTEPSMRRFGNALVTLFMAAEYETRSPNATLAHSIRVHLLNPQPEFRVNYVKTGRSEDELETGKNKSDFDLVFAIQGKTAHLGFVMKVELDEATTTSDPVLNKTYLEVFETGELGCVTDNATVKVVANLCCDDHICKLSYLFNSTQLDQEQHLGIGKAQLRRLAEKRWEKF